MNTVAPTHRCIVTSQRFDSKRNVVCLMPHAILHQVSSWLDGVTQTETTLASLSETEHKVKDELRGDSVCPFEELMFYRVILSVCVVTVNQLDVKTACICLSVDMVCSCS